MSPLCGSGVAEISHRSMSVCLDHKHKMNCPRTKNFETFSWLEETNKPEGRKRTWSAAISGDLGVQKAIHQGYGTNKQPSRLTKKDHVFVAKNSGSGFRCRAAPGFWTLVKSRNGIFTAAVQLLRVCPGLQLFLLFWDKEKIETSI